MDLSRLYHPITAAPFRNDHTYREGTPASPLLRPWIRCLWGSLPNSGPSAGIVIPDTCTDIIFRIDDLNGLISPTYCALYDQTFFSQPGPADSAEFFAIRFYPWAAPAFLQDSLKGSLNCTFDAREHFPSLVHELLRMLDETRSFEERCSRAEGILLSHLAKDSVRPALMNAMADILLNKGRLRMTELAQRSQLSTRQLERLFREQTGASPKKLSNMIRYQYLWQEAVMSPRFDIQDAVFRYGYADQSHLLRQFKQYHAMTLNEAAAYARSNVAFIQYSETGL